MNPFALFQRESLLRLWQPDGRLKQRMLQDHQVLMAVALGLGGLLGTGYWLWDWAQDAVGSAQTWPWRLGYLLLPLVSLLVLRLRRPAAVGLAVLLSVVGSEVLYCLLLTELRQGMQTGLAGFAIYYFFVLLLCSGLALPWLVAFLVLLAGLPHGLALAGWMPGFPHLVYGLLVWPMTLCTAFVFLLTAQSYLRRNDLEAMLEAASNTDALTGVSNRRHFMPALERELQRARRLRHEMAVLMIDIDHFKRINDTHGHPTGDLAIQLLAQLCSKASREMDLVARLGGEEFAILLPEAGLAQALAVGERLRQLAEAGEIRNEQGEPVRFTVSVGAAALSAQLDSGAALLAQADAALYQAKNSGRNRVMAAAA